MIPDKDKREMNELPEEMRRLIRKDVEAGLDGLRSRGFESRLRARLRSAAERGGQVPERRGWRWAPVAAGAAALALVAVAILWFGRVSRPSGPTPLVSALGGLPGFRTLEQASPDQLGLGSPSTSPISPLLRPLAGALSQAAGREPEVEMPATVAPRYSLQQKLEILTKEKPIERALQSIKTNLGEV